MKRRVNSQRIKYKLDEIASRRWHAIMFHLSLIHRRWFNSRPLTANNKQGNDITIRHGFQFVASNSIEINMAKMITTSTKGWWIGRETDTLCVFEQNQVIYQHVTIEMSSHPSKGKLLKAICRATFLFVFQCKWVLHIFIWPRLVKWSPINVRNGDLKWER